MTAKRRVCVYCHHPLAERRPVFLTMDRDGKILGPLHISCAWKLGASSSELQEQYRHRASQFGSMITELVPVELSEREMEEEGRL